MKEKRISYIDIIKAIAIILIIIGHVNYSYINPEIKRFVYSFNVLIFFFVIGLIYAQKKSKLDNFKDVFVKKFRSIYIPYILWALIYSSFTPVNLFYILYGSHLSLKVNNNSSLWFLPCFFITVLLFEFVIRIQCKNKNKYLKNNILMIIIAIISLAISVCLPKNLGYGFPMGINASFMGLVFAIFGYLISPLLQKITKQKTYHVFTLFLIFALSMFSYKLNNDVSYVLVAENLYGNIPLFLFTALSGCLMVSFLAISLDKILKGKIKILINYIGKNTLVIFAFQKPLLSLTIKAFEIFGVVIPDFIVLIISVVVVLSGSIVFIKLTEKFVPQLSGK